MTREERLAELFESFPPEAKRVYESGAEGEEWKEGRDSIEGADAWYYFCDDCENWHKSWFVPEYVVRLGRVDLVVHDVDTDGDWDICDEFNALDADDMARYERDFGCEAWGAQYDEYARHVAETGEDPCDEFIVKTSDKETQSWTICAGPAPEGAAGLQVVSGKLASEASWREPGALPRGVLEYLTAESSAHGYVMQDVASFSRLDELLGSETPPKASRPRADGLCREFDVTVDIITPRAEETVRAELIELAKKHLEQREQKRAAG